MFESLIPKVRFASWSWLTAPLLILASACLPCISFSAEAALSEATAADKATSALTPELERKLAEFLTKAREAKRKVWEADMKKRVEELVKVTGLDAAGVKALDVPMTQAIVSAIDDWAGKLEKGWRDWANAAPPDAMEMAAAALNQIDQTVRTDWFGKDVRPDEQTQWRTGLQAALNGEQLLQWDRAESERRQAALAEIAGAIRASGERTREEIDKHFGTQYMKIQNALGLSAERAGKLRVLIRDIAKTHVEKWKSRAERSLLALDAETRKGAVRNGQVYIAPDPEVQKSMETSWDEGIAKLLSADELARVKSNEVDGRQRGIRAIARILVLNLDEQVAFTAEQRERLRPIAERLVGGISSLSGDLGDGRSFQLHSQNLVEAAKRATEEELKLILDPVQLRRWKDACSGKSTLSRSRIMVLGAQAAPVKADPPGKVYEPEDLENAISDYLNEQAAAERKRLLTIQMLKAEDAARVARLEPPAAARLVTAARGTAEEELTQWKANTEQSIRSQLHDVTPENVRQRLAGMERFSFGRRSSPHPTLGALWEHAVKTELTDAERATWKKERDARSAYADQAIGNFIMLELSRRIPLSREQWQKLDPLVCAAVRDYGPDIVSMFSYSYGSTWYLQSYTLLIPVAAVPEKELKTILTKEQLDRWMTGEEFANINSYWENIQRLHTNRVKERQQ